MRCGLRAIWIQKKDAVKNLVILSRADGEGSLTFSARRETEMVRDVSPAAAGST
ncbi:MAG: hypothetical protein QOD64_1486, partial [Verrucomicrobiota bacterium]